MCALTSSFPIVIRYVLGEATSAVDFLANWACTHRVSQCFLSSRDLLIGLSGNLHLDAKEIPHIRRYDCLFYSFSCCFILLPSFLCICIYLGELWLIFPPLYVLHHWFISQIWVLPNPLPLGGLNKKTIIIIKVMMMTTITTILINNNNNENDNN